MISREKNKRNKVTKEEKEEIEKQRVEEKEKERNEINVRRKFHSVLFFVSVNSQSDKTKQNRTNP